MRRAVLALVVTVAVVVWLARYETTPPRTVDRAIVQARPTPRGLDAPEDRASRVGRPRRGERSATGPALSTPFSVIQVRATVRGRRIVGVETVAMSGDGPHTEALNARAEPILRREVLRTGTADVDTVSGATSSSRSWLDSLEGAVAKARRRG